MNIVAIGGGDLGAGDTLSIDKFIVKLSGKKKPKALFVPTATGDDKDYCKAFKEIYGKKLGCKTDNLLLFNRESNRNQIREKIFGSDIIYVGGGNTLRMMKLWRKLGVDRLLEKAGSQGTILAGLSAGAICWHQWGHSDSRAFSSPSDWSYIRVKGLGFIPVIFCPHLDSEKRHKPFKDMIMKHGGLGIACEDNAAVWYQGNKKPVIKCSKKSAAVRIYRKNNRGIVIETFHCGEKLVHV